MTRLARHERLLLERILLNQVRAEDRLELSDATLRAAIQGERRLTVEEANLLLVSPLTLRRFRFLSDQRRALGGWLGSEGLLLAAAGGLDQPAMATEDGCWNLVFLPGVGGSLRVTLKYVGSGDLAERLAAAGTGVVVVDAKGLPLLWGELDEDGELEAPWLLEPAPREHFLATGGRFSVRPMPPGFGT